MRLWILLVLVAPFVSLAACGDAGNALVSEEPVDASTKDEGPPEVPSEAGVRDASSDDGPSTVPDAPRCDLQRPFGKPVAVKGAEGGNSASLSPDELTIYFFTYMGNQQTVFSATRASKDAAFGARKPVYTRSSYAPHVTADGLTMIFSTYDDGSVFKATRSDKNTSFGAPSNLISLGSTDSTTATFVSADGKTIAVSRSSASKASLSWSVDGGPLTRIPGTTSTQFAWNPVLSSDGLTLLWADSGTDPTGRHSIWMAKRDAKDKPFADAHVLKEFEAGYDAPNWLSPDGCVLYLGGRASLLTGIKRASRPL